MIPKTSEVCVRARVSICVCYCLYPSITASSSPVWLARRRRAVPSDEGPWVGPWGGSSRRCVVSDTWPPDLSLSGCASGSSTWHTDHRPCKGPQNTQSHSPAYVWKTVWDHRQLNTKNCDKKSILIFPSGQKGTCQCSVCVFHYNKLEYIDKRALPLSIPVGHDVMTRRNDDNPSGGSNCRVHQGKQSGAGRR